MTGIFACSGDNLDYNWALDNKGLAEEHRILRQLGTKANLPHGKIILLESSTFSWPCTTHQ
jgi:hypothetical protein